MAIIKNPGMKDLRGDSRRTFLKLVGAAGAAFALERSKVLNYLLDEGGSALADSGSPSVADRSHPRPPYRRRPRVATWLAAMLGSPGRLSTLRQTSRENPPRPRPSRRGFGLLRLGSRCCGRGRIGRWC